MLAAPSPGSISGRTLPVCALLDAVDTGLLGERRGAGSCGLEILSRECGHSKRGKKFVLCDRS